ncbi:Asp23/Gls24 family envelope stress response protein [Agromyces sp. ZXT2-6]|uniref:Asp23/Gls24 family envelope stress response protein n=1 Tax=Agromyces sp. ZXT2-6 TaxID=3461153 RepID=UPI004054AE7D
MNDAARVTPECGKTIDELSDYLTAGRTPYDPAIETCPECLNELRALARVARLSRDLIAQDAAELPAPPESWMQAILSDIHREMRAGRDLPIHHPDPRVRISVTEGAVRALLRDVADDIDGLIVGRCELLGAAERPGAPIRVHLTASAMWGRSVPELSATLRDRVAAALSRHTELVVAAVDVTIADLHGYAPAEEQR